MIITLSACAASLWLMINNFHFPAEEVLRIAAVCFVLVVPLVLIAAVLGFILRKFNDRQLDQSMKVELNEIDREASSVNSANVNGEAKENSGISEDHGSGGDGSEVESKVESKVERTSSDKNESEQNKEQEFDSENKTIKTSEERNHS